MPDNPRFALYGASYTCLLANKLDQPAEFPCSVVGRCCESGDIIQEHVLLPGSVGRGDILAVCTTGLQLLHGLQLQPPSQAPHCHAPGRQRVLCGSPPGVPGGSVPQRPVKRTRERPHRGPLPSCLLKTCFRQAAGLWSLLNGSKSRLIRRERQPGRFSFTRSSLRILLRGGFIGSCSHPLS